MQMGRFRANPFRPLAFLLLSVTLAPAKLQIAPEPCSNFICRIVAYGRIADLRWQLFSLFAQLVRE